MPVFEQAMADGEGSAYFFAQYAESLTRLGRIDDAIPCHAGSVVSPCYRGKKGRLSTQIGRRTVPRPKYASARRPREGKA